MARQARTLRRIVFLWVVCLALVSPAAAQGDEESAEAIVISTDAFRRDNPRRFQMALLNAMAADNPGLLTNYLEVKDVGSEDALQKARAFKAAMDANGIFPAKLTLSVEPAGDLDDGLPEDQEEVARVQLDDEEIPVIARHIEDEEGNAFWVISADTLAELPKIPADAQAGPAEPAPETDELRLFGAPLRSWAAMLCAAVVSFALILFVMKLIHRWLGAGNPSPVRAATAHVFWAFAHPAALYLVYVLISYLSGPLGAGAVETTVLKRGSSLVGWFALIWLIWRLVGALRGLIAASMRRNGQLDHLGVVNFIGRTLRFFVLVVGIGVLFATFGVDVTAMLAALGIGGLALALGARKAVEDLVGSIVILAEQPVRIGETCRIDDIVGDVMDIGLRSTVLRTRDRTLLTIPNSQFADSKIENLTSRDNFLIDQTFALALDLDADTVERALAAVRQVIAQTPECVPSKCPVRFEGFAGSTYAVRILSRLECASYADGCLLQEKILLEVMRRLAECGVAFALPAQHVEQGLGEGTHGDPPGS